MHVFDPQDVVGVYFGILEQQASCEHFLRNGSGASNDSGNWDGRAHDFNYGEQNVDFQRIICACNLISLVSNDRLCD